MERQVTTSKRWDKNLRLAATKVTAPAPETRLLPTSEPQQVTRISVDNLGWICFVLGSPKSQILSKEGRNNRGPLMSLRMCRK